MKHWNSIPIILTRNPRARRVWLKMHAGQGLEVVLPGHVPSADLPQILERHREWIFQHHAHMKARNEAPGQSLIPERVEFTFLERAYAVQCEDAPQARLRLEGDTVHLMFPNAQEALGIRLLQWLLLEVGKKHVRSHCLCLAAELGISVAQVTVRNQSSKWGSCSARRTISLNAKLLFLPQVLARHVMLHEFSHLEHPNHGPKFWQRLHELDPQTPEHDHALNQAWNALPAWSKFVARQ